MLETLFIILRRICVCGIFSAIVMAITIDNCQKEIIKVCCASIMIIAIFTPATTSQVADMPEFSTKNLEIEADSAMLSLVQNQKDVMCRKIEEYAANQAGEGKFSVEADVLDGELVISTVTIYGKGLNTQKIIDILKTECGAVNSKIIFVE